MALQFLFNSTTDLPENQRRQNKSLYKVVLTARMVDVVCCCEHWFWFCWSSLILAHLACKWSSIELLKNLWRRRSTGSIVPSLMLWNSAKNPLERVVTCSFLWEALVPTTSCSFLCPLFYWADTHVILWWYLSDTYAILSRYSGDTDLIPWWHWASTVMILGRVFTAVDTIASLETSGQDNIWANIC